MKKILILLLTIMAMAFTAKSQHQIITNNGDTIIGKIKYLSDGNYTYWRITKPKGLKAISEKEVKQLIAIGPDTLFDTYKNASTNAYQKDSSVLDYDLSDKISEADKTPAYYLRRSGENLMAAKVVLLCSGLAVIVVSQVQPSGAIIVASGGILISTILEFIGIQHLMNAGDKMRKEELERKRLNN